MGPSNRIVTFQIVRHFPLNHDYGRKSTRMSQEVIGSMDRINGLFHLLINGYIVDWGEHNPLIPTFDPITS